MRKPTRTSAHEMKRRTDSSEPIFYIDARNLEAWSKSDVKLPGAILVCYSELDQHPDELPCVRLTVTYRR